MRDSHTCQPMPVDTDTAVSIERVREAGEGYWLIVLSDDYASTVSVRLTFCPWCGVRL